MLEISASGHVSQSFALQAHADQTSQVNRSVLLRCCFNTLFFVLECVNDKTYQEKNCAEQIAVNASSLKVGCSPAFPLCALVWVHPEGTLLISFWSLLLTCLGL